jgi:hypothetical protein
MGADIARLLSPLVNTGSLAFRVLVLWPFVVGADLTPFYNHLQAFELPLSKVLSASTSPVLSKPLPEQVPEPYRDLPGTEWIRLLKIHNNNPAGGAMLALEKFPLLPTMHCHTRKILPRGCPKIETPRSTD